MQKKSNNKMSRQQHDKSTVNSYKRRLKQDNDWQLRVMRSKLMIFESN